MVDYMINKKKNKETFSSEMIKLFFQCFQINIFMYIYAKSNFKKIDHVFALFPYNSSIGIPNETFETSKK